MSKRTLAVSFLTAGMTAGLIAGVVGPAAAQGNPVGGAGNVYYLSGAGNTGGVAQEVLVFGDPGDEVFFGDWDNDGTDTPMINRNGVFHVADENGKTVDVFAYGNPGDRVVIGDWDGKNGDSMAVVRTESGSNRFLVKNDVKTTGKADSDFFYGDAGDNILVGDWDGDGDDTLMVTRPDTSFHVKNTSGGGVADYNFTYGNPGDTIIVGDWADPANGKSGDGADQIAVRRDGNHYFFSKELGEKADIATAMRDQRYGEPTDTVFAASLPSVELDKDGKPYPNNEKAKTYAADVPVTHKAGDPILVWDTDGNNTFAQLKDPVTQALQTYKGNEAVVQMPGTPQVYRGGEGVITADGKPVVYVADATAVAGDENKRDITDAEGYHKASDGKITIAKYVADEPVLDAAGNFVWVKVAEGQYALQTWTASTSPSASQKTLPSGDANKVTVKVGDQVLRRAGEQAVLVKGSPALRPTTGAAEDGRVTGNAVVEHETGDIMFEADGTIARNANGTVRTYQANERVESKTEKYQAGAPVLHRKGEPVKAYKWVAGTAGVAAVTRVETVDTSAVGTATITIAAAEITSADAGRPITGPGIAAGTTVASVTGTAVTLSDNLVAGGSATASVTIEESAAVPAGSGAWDNATTASNPIIDDEDSTLYTSKDLVNGAPDASKSVKKLDDNNSSNPVFYAGTEQYVTTGEVNLPDFKGGEAVTGHKKGDVVRDKDGKVVMVSTSIKGDGLGVRRHFG